MSSEGIMGEPLPFEERIVPASHSGKVVDPKSYFELHRAAVEDLEGFWGRVAEELEWFRKWDRVLVPGEHPNVYRLSLIHI